jgi:hypothetical protein
MITFVFCICLSFGSISTCERKHVAFVFLNLTYFIDGRLDKIYGTVVTDLQTLLSEEKSYGCVSLLLRNCFLPQYAPVAGWGVAEQSLAKQ